jgi:hypothetical protein
MNESSANLTQVVLLSKVGISVFSGLVRPFNFVQKCRIKFKMIYGVHVLLFSQI